MPAVPTQAHRARYSLEGPPKDAIDSLQKQIDLLVVEASRLRYAQNSHVAISRLPAELLSDAFLYVIESGLRKNDTCFDTGTFNFLLVCRRWNEVAVAFPRLWVWWVASAGKAWHLFNARSKDAPLFLTWVSRLPDSATDAFLDTKASRRIRRLNFFDSRTQLECLLGALDSTSMSITSSIRVVTDYGNKGEHLTRFLSLSFPKLSELDIGNFLPDPSSSIFTTSSLTSLEIYLNEDVEHRYTRSQFSQILQQHPNLQKLTLKAGAIPLAGQSGSPVSVILPQLIDLELDGTGTSIAGFMDLVSMSPLHNVAIHLEHPHTPTVPALSSAVKQILTAYYDCQGLEYPRKADRLTVELRYELLISAGSFTTPACNLTLQSWTTTEMFVGTVVSLFPLESTRVFAAEGVDIATDYWRAILQNMKELSELRLNRLDIRPVLEALSFDDEGAYGSQVPNHIESLMGV